MGGMKETLPQTQRDPMALFSLVCTFAKAYNVACVAQVPVLTTVNLVYKHCVL